MPPGDEPTAESFESEATELLESIGRARKKVEGIAGVLDGTLDRYRERIDRLIRESEVDNWRQVRIFTRDVETIAADLGKAVKEKRLSPTPARAGGSACPRLRPAPIRIPSCGC